MKRGGGGGGEGWLGVKSFSLWKGNNNEWRVRD